MVRGAGRRGRAGWAIVVGAGLAAVLAACTGTTARPDPTLTPSPPPPEPVTVSWQFRAGGEPLAALWREVAAEFEAANPHVTVELTEVGLDDPLPDAAHLPDVFDAPDLAQLATLAAAGDLRDLTDGLAAELAAIGGPVAAFQLDGRSFAVPWTFSAFGFWVNMDVLASAGIEDVPATFADLLGVVDALRAAGVTPIALDGFSPTKELYWDELVLMSCSSEALAVAATTLRFDDPCFVDAGAHLVELVAADPFDEDYLSRSPGGDDDAEGSVVTGRAGMLLSGAWSLDVMRRRFEGTGRAASAFPELAWCPFPALRDGPGDGTAVLGQGNAFSVAADAPDAAVALLQHVLSVDVQARLGELGGWTPVVAGTEGAVDGALQPMLAAQRAAQRVSQYLSVAYDPAVAYARDEAVVHLFLGDGTPQDVVDAMNAAAETLEVSGARRPG